VLESTVVVLLVPSKPPVTTTKALVLLMGTTTALRPVRAVGRAVVVVHVTLLTLNVSVCTRATTTPLLVPPEVTTVTVTVPDTVNEFVPSPDGTTTTMPVSDHPEAFGVTVATMLPWVKRTCPGELWKPLPFISMGRPTGLEGVVELLILEIEGTGVVVAPPPPPPQPTKKAATVIMSTAQLAIVHPSRCISIFLGPGPLG
jgi:hypothetical protein